MTSECPVCREEGCRHSAFVAVEVTAPAAVGPVMAADDREPPIMTCSQGHRFRVKTMQIDLNRVAEYELAERLEDAPAE